MGAESSKQDTLLYQAVEARQFDVASQILDDFDPALTSSPQFQDSIQLATISGKTRLVEKMLKLSIPGSVNASDEDGGTLLMCAAANGRLETAKMLVRSGAEVNLQDDIGSTALHRAAEWGNLNVIVFLVETAKADTTVKDEEGSTALDWGRKNNNTPVVDYLGSISPPVLELDEPGSSTISRRIRRD